MSFVAALLILFDVCEFVNQVLNHVFETNGLGRGESGDWIARKIYVAIKGCDNSASESKNLVSSIENLDRFHQAPSCRGQER